MNLSGTLRNRLVFYGEAWRSMWQVGAFSITSRPVARAVVEPLARMPSPRRVLEVGAGTGALTRPLIERLGPGDRLEVLEINAAFVRLLREELAPVEGPKLEILERDVEEIDPEARYDLIVSSLPLMNFDPDKVRRVLALYSARLAPGGTIAYWDYWGKEIRTFISPASERRRMRRVLRATREFHERHACRRRVIPWNVPPACVWHVQHPPG